MKKRGSSSQVAYLNAHGPYEHGIWKYKNAWQDKVSQVNDSRLFLQRSLELVEQISEQLLRSFTLKELKNKNVLDVGCYDGWILHSLHKKFKFKRALGIEPRLKNINKGIYARHFYKIKTDCEFQIGTVESVKQSFSRSPFDIVLCLGLLHHVSSTPDTIKSLSEITKEMLIIDSMVIPEVKKEKKEILKYLNLKDLVYFGEKKLWSIAAYKFESPYFDGSANESKIVNVPGENLIQMSLMENNFEIIKQTNPEENHYDSMKQRIRGVKEVLIFSRRSLGTNSQIKIKGKIYEHEFVNTAEKVDPQIIVMWLSKLKLSREAKQLKSHITPRAYRYLIKNIVLFKFSESPTNKLFKLLAKHFEKSQAKLELLSNVSRAPVDKIYLEVGKFYYSLKLYDASCEFLESIINRVDADWRSFYRACYLLSLIYTDLGDNSTRLNFIELLKISNPNFPELNL